MLLADLVRQAIAISALLLYVERVELLREDAVSDARAVYAHASLMLITDRHERHRMWSVLIMEPSL